MAMFDIVKLALRRAETNAYDAEIRALIIAACYDLSIAGVETPAFSASSSYNPGDRVVQGGEYYICTTATEAGDFNSQNWQPDALFARAVCTYCKMHFGESDEFEHLHDSYNEQKAQLQMATPYTNYDAYGIKTALGG